MDITSFASKSLYCSNGAPQKGKPELCPYVGYDRCIPLPAFFSCFFCQSFVDDETFNSTIFKFKDFKNASYFNLSSPEKKL